MMTKLMIDEKYAKELDKAEIDHHKPTAGAMLGHVLSNLFIENIRLTQAGIYAKIPVKCEYLREIAQREVEYFFKISDLLLDENEIVPSTTEEFLKYHKFITEDPKAKYWTDEDLLESFKLFATWQVTWVKALLIFMTKMKIMIISFYETVGFS